MSKFNAPNPRPTPITPPKAPVGQAPQNKAPVKTEVRNSPIPKAQPARPATSASPARNITRDEIALRAYFIWKQSGGSEFDNWVRAERELRGGK